MQIAGNGTPDQDNSKRSLEAVVFECAYLELI